MTIVYIIITLLMLTLLVTVHEYGHYLVAKRCGVEIEEFAIGMGPALYKKQGKETLFSVRALPIGGYCKMRGEEEDEDEEDAIEITDRDFRAKSKPQRFAILSAGVVMNFILGFLLLLLAFSILGIMQGASPLRVIQLSFQYFGRYAVAIIESLKMIVTGGVSANDLAGPIGMVSMVEQVYSYGWINLLAFAAFISINLGIMNLLPIPALDGGQMFIILCEGVSRRNLSDRVKNILIGASFVVLMGLMVFVAYNDIARIFAG